MKKEKRRPQGHKRKKRIPIPKWNPKIRFVDPDDSILCSDVYSLDKNPKPRKYGLY